MNFKILAFIILIINISRSNPIYIWGNITDEDGNRIENVNIYSINQSIGTYSNSEGKFQLNVEHDSIYEIHFSHIGYELRKIYIEIKNESINTGDISLKRKNIRNEEILVSISTANSISIKDSPVLTHVITNNDIKNSSSTNVMELLETNMPNIQSLLDPHGTFKIKIQGFDNKNITFMQDGFKISGETYGNIDFSLFNIDNIEQIEVVRGGMSTLYGSGAIGGIVNIKSKSNKNGLSFKFNNSYESLINKNKINFTSPILNSNSINFGIKNNYISNNLNVNYSYSNGYDLTPPNQNLSGKIDKTLDENYSFLVDNKLKYFLKENIEISAHLKWYKKKIFRYEKLSPAYIIIDNIPEDSLVVERKKNPEYQDRVYSINFNYKINDKSNFFISYSNETYLKGYRFPYYEGDYPIQINEKIINAIIPNYRSLNVIYNFFINQHELSIGNELKFESTESNVIYDRDSTDILVTSIFNVNDRKNTKNHSIFIIDRFKINENLNLDIGLRYNKNKNREIFLPSISIKNNYHKYIFRLNFSHNYRLPSVTELYYDFPGHSPPIYGNSNLMPQLSNNYSFSVEHKELNNSSIELYLNNNYNMIGYDYKSECECYQTDNYKEVTLYGINLNNSGIIKTLNSKVINYKTILSYTDSESIYNSPTEGISKYSMKTFFSFNINKIIKINYSLKYLSDKIIFETQLEDHFISDLVFNYNLNKNINLKFGIKNIFNYKDSRAIDEESDLLTTYDPGRRFLLNINYTK